MSELVATARSRRSLIRSRSPLIGCMTRSSHNDLLLPDVVALLLHTLNAVTRRVLLLILSIGAT